MFITEANPDHIAQLWQRLRAMLARASGIIGAIETLVTLTSLTRARRRDIVGPIALLEAIVRKLIFIEAAAIRRAELAPPRDPRACPERLAPRIRDVWGPNPPPPPPPPPRKLREVAPSPQRLALRFEALRRVIADPAPYARRLAKILPRLHRRFPEAPMRYVIAGARPYWLDREDWRLISEAMTVAMIVAPIFANTS